MSAITSDVVGGEGKIAPPEPLRKHQRFFNATAITVTNQTYK